MTSKRSTVATRPCARSFADGPVHHGIRKRGPELGECRKAFARAAAERREARRPASLAGDLRRSGDRPDRKAKGVATTGSAALLPTTGNGGRGARGRDTHPAPRMSSFRGRRPRFRVARAPEHVSRTSLPSRRSLRLLHAPCSLLERSPNNNTHQRLCLLASKMPCPPPGSIRRNRAQSRPAGPRCGPTCGPADARR